MAKIRTIKPEMWTSEQVVSCTRDARLLFIGLLNFCDDAGIHPASFKRLQMQVFPSDNCTVEDIQRWVEELITNGLLIQYAAGDKAYWQVTGWKHQRIDKPTYRYPQPPQQFSADISATQQPLDPAHTTTPLRPSVEESTPTLRHLEDSSTPQRPRNGREGIGMDLNICEVDNSTSPLVEKENKEVLEIFQYWQAVMSRHKAKLDRKRKNTIMQALKLGFSCAELKQAIDGCKNSPFHQGNNERRQRYDDLSLIFRNAEYIERFMNNSIESCANFPSNVFKGAI